MKISNRGLRTLGVALVMTGAAMVWAGIVVGFYSKPLYATLSACPVAPQGETCIGTSARGWVIRTPEGDEIRAIHLYALSDERFDVLVSDDIAPEVFERATLHRGR